MRTGPSLVFVQFLFVWPACSSTLRHARGLDASLSHDQAASTGQTYRQREASDLSKAVPEFDTVRKRLDQGMEAEAQDFMRRDVARMMKTLMPGFEFSGIVMAITLSSVIASFAWLLVYFNAIYKSDSAQKLTHQRIDHTSASVPAVTACSEEDEEVAEANPFARGRQLRAEDGTVVAAPDLILVFHHPTFKYGDQNTLVPMSTIERVISYKGEFESVERIMGIRRRESCGARTKDFIFVRTAHRWTRTSADEAMEAGDTQRGEEPALSASVGTAAPAAPPSGSPSGSPSASPAARKGGARRSAVRIAVLKDLHACLRKMGFQVNVFSSIDYDEIFLGVSLLDEEVAEHYILRNNIHLQIKQAVVRNLGISQPVDDPAASPPSIRFDVRTVESLHTAGVLAEADKRELYHTYPGRHPKGNIIGSRHRILTIFGELCQHVDLDAAKEHGLLVDWYPVHSQFWLDKLRALWANWGLIWDLSFVQPVPLIREYFGSRLAFAFAWKGIHCKALLALVPVAAFLEIVAIIGKEYFNLRQNTDRPVLAPSIIVLIWARMTLNLWDREEAFFLRLWEIDPHMQDTIVRAGFRGFLQPSEVDANLEELQYPARWAWGRKCISMLATILCCCFVMLTIYKWMSVFEGKMDLAASLCLSFQIKFFELMYNYMVAALMEFENHRHQTDHYNSYLWKQFLFQSVNTYSAFFFLAFRQKTTGAHCPAGGCLHVLQKQLALVQIILSACLLGQVIFLAYCTKFSLWYEDYRLRAAGQEPPDRPFVEEQAKFPEYRTREQIETMTQLVLSVGFVILFGAVAPMMAPFCFLVFAVTLRAYACMLTNACKRTVPRQMPGIGEYRAVVAVLMMVGVVASGFLIVLYGESFEGAAIITRVTGVVLFCLSAVFMGAIIDIVFPATLRQTSVLARRRGHVQRKIFEVCGDVSISDATVKISEDLSPESTRMIQEGAWTKIQHLSATAGLSARSAPAAAAEDDEVALEA